MKKVINGIELKNAMKDAISLLCGTVKTTLGPKGNNVIIDHSTFSPFITNDGVTIAENIESDDPVINTILELAKEASIKMNEVAGDGTTTTLVLLESIFNKGIDLIESGINPLVVKRELDISLEHVIKIIKEKSRKPKFEQLMHIASISANDKEIGLLVSKVYKKVKNGKVINVIESDSDKTYVEFTKGYTFDTMLASPYFLKKSEISFNEPYFILINDCIENIEQIAEILNLIIKEKKDLVILARDYSDFVVNEILSIVLDNDINIILLKNPTYGLNQIAFYNDLNVIIQNKLINNSNFIDVSSLGKVESIKLNQEKTTINFKINSDIKNYIKCLNKQKKENTLDNFDERIAMFETGTAKIIVGAPTKLERREKKMRIDDAICAIDSCKDGILPGSGLTLLEISDSMINDSIGNNILKDSLSKPIEQILTNAALDFSIIDEIKKNNYKIIYDLNSNNYEDIFDTKILDPTLVVINSLKNACSIVGMMLTTNSLVINEYKNELNKTNDFNNL